MPNITLYPDVSVVKADKQLLSMLVETTPLPLADDKDEVPFYEGEPMDAVSFDETLWFRS